jgi:hypothetical protein
MKVVALAGLVLALAGGVAAASSEANVTLAMRQYTNENKIRVFVWSGRIASNASGEDVEVLGRDCLTKDFRLYAGTQSTPGGGFEVESAQRTTPYNIVDVNSGTTFRARWRGHLSNTILHKTAITVFYTMKIPKRRAWKVIVNPMPLYMTLKGEPVVLQRMRGGKWERYRTAPLDLKANYEYGGATNYEAVFEIPARGLQLRALLATKSVAPCYSGRATAPFRT